MHYWSQNKARIYLRPSKLRGHSLCLTSRAINQILHQGLEEEGDGGVQRVGDRVQCLCKLTLLRNPCRLQVNSPWPSCSPLPPLHMCFTYPQLAQVQWKGAVEAAHPQPGPDTAQLLIWALEMHLFLCEVQLLHTLFTHKCVILTVNHYWRTIVSFLQEEEITV